MSKPYGKLHFILKYFLHFFTARNTKGFGVHSPYLFDYVRNVLMEKKEYYVFKEIEEIRLSLKSNPKTVKIEDLGSGKNRVETVSGIAKKSLKPRKQAQLLFRVVNHFKFQNILELGTSLGITTLYLANVSKNSKCITLEGIADIAKVASDNFSLLDNQNIELVLGNIDVTLKEQFSKGPFDFVFMDANHRYQPMKKYFQQITEHLADGAIIVIDDIHHSREMELFWKEAILNNKITTSIDIFHMGILFTNPYLKNKNYTLLF